jgi:hypothetical protein
MNTQSYYIMDSEILYPLYPLYHIISYFSECIRMYANYIVYLSCSPLDSTVVRPTVLGTARPTSRKSSWGSTWKIGAAPRNATRHWSQRRRRSALALRPLEKSLLRCLEKLRSEWSMPPCTCKYVICVLYIPCIMSYVLICLNIHKGWRWYVLLCLLCVVFSSPIPNMSITPVNAPDMEKLWESLTGGCNVVGQLLAITMENHHV